MKIKELSFERAIEICSRFTNCKECPLRHDEYDVCCIEPVYGQTSQLLRLYYDDEDYFNKEIDDETN